MIPPDSDTIAQTIIWAAQERIGDGEPYQNLNSAIEAITIEVSLCLMGFMAGIKGDQR